MKDSFKKLRHASLMGALLLSVVLSSSCAQSSKTKKPNILWITIEDTSPQFIGCYGNKDASTPVIDGLAAEGVRFNNAFSTGTVCSPSRTAIITGIKTYETGAGNHRSSIPLPEQIKGFPYYLKQQGYYTTNNKKTDYNVTDEAGFIREAWHVSSSKAGWWSRKEGQPFFSVFNFMDSHQSRTMTRKYDWYKKRVWEALSEEERIGENDFEMPPFYNDTPEMRRQFARVYNSIKLTDNKIGSLLGRLEKDGLKDSTIIFFFADHGEGIPRGKTNGINLGYRVPFLVWFPEMYKHLSPWGTGDVVTDELISFEDLAPTIISLAGGELPEHLSGRVFMGDERAAPPDYLVLSSDRSDNGIDMVRSVTNGRFLYSRNFLPFMPEARYIRYMEISDMKQLMREDYRQGSLNELQNSLFEERPPEFLFDIEKDKWETENLANDPEYSELLSDMRQHSRDEVIGSKDVLFLPEYEIGLISKNTTPYEYRLTSKYPVEEIYDVASVSGFRGKKYAEKQIDWLSNSNEIVRYWAAVGLRSQSHNVLKPYFDRLIEAMDDEYLPVSVTAAAICYQQMGNEKAERRLKEYILHPNNDLALMAINYLLYVDNKKPFIKTIKETRKMEVRDYNTLAASLDFLGSLGLVPNNPDFRK